MLTYLERTDLEVLGRKAGPGHWDEHLMDGRWDYHERAIEIVKSLQISEADQILEMGTMGASLVVGSHTLDCDKLWDFPGKKPTYNHDARKLPWPIADASYELFVALRVFQHLAPVQHDCFNQVKRVARRLILVVPSSYQNEVHPSSRGVTYSDLLEWNNGVVPTTFVETLFGDLYYWDEHALAAPAKSPRRPPRMALKKLKSVGRKALDCVLHPLALEIRRKERIGRDVAQSSVNRKQTAETAFIVEFVGASGVGKSLLCREVLRTKKDTDIWMRSEECLIEACDLEAVADPKDPFGRLWEELLRKKLEEISCLAVQPLAVYQVLRHLQDIAVQDVNIRRKLSNACVFLEEGVCHNFGNQLLEWQKSRHEAFLRMLEHRLVIFCHAEPEVIYHRILRRSESGFVMPLHRGKTEEELKVIIRETQAIHEKLRCAMESLSLRCLLVDCSRPEHIQAELVQDFIRAAAQNL